MATNPQTRIIAGISVLDTPLITKSLAYARKYMDDQGYNHVVRSWLAGMAIISHLPDAVKKNLDIEAINIAAILHDLGWSNSSDVTSTDKRFEVDGANAAREFLQREGGPTWGHHRIQLVWDAIALHTTRSINKFKEPEVALTAAGIVTELLGPELAKAQYTVTNVTIEEYEMIVSEYPNKGLRGYLRDTMCGLCVRKPETTYDNFVSGYGERFVEGYTLEGRKSVDIMEKVLAE
ncbi:hypothetical protein GQ43DRAFT_473892 [Delitschia confertaspora ATCC 74209]|uniref:HD domain-containing protein n=1 Tax=Delitschia confertaspora ATCC 74209 TaxID=1513339 RepID=A0A9P4JHD2_9PLEO|nr:hypothetical protein GQ43DRAFT_473892 [Delitschia confertaspora ATCC 74209]